MKVKKTVCECIVFFSFKKLYFILDVVVYGSERETKKVITMELGSIFETVMLVCFGFSWPLNVMKAYRARTAKGTSLLFILLIIAGYIGGISAKLLNHQINYVLVVYFLNLGIVLVNLCVYFRNVHLDKMNDVVVKNHAAKYSA